MILDPPFFTPLTSILWRLVLLFDEFEKAVNACRDAVVDALQDFVERFHASLDPLPGDTIGRPSGPCNRRATG